VKVVVAADHAGYELKRHLVSWLGDEGHEVLDLGTHSDAPVDYPPLCAAAADAVVRGDAARGVVIGGSGQGEQIAANKVHGIRAALCHDEWMSEMARRHNDANVVTLSGARLGPQQADAIVATFLRTEFEGGRHARRVGQISQLEDRRQEAATVLQP
jgi:ribose 5-phosphate isomerase B